MTDRHVLRLLARTDADAVVRYRSLPEVSRYQSWAPESSAAVAAYADAIGRLPFLCADQWFQLAIADPATDAIRGDLAVQMTEGGRVEVGVALDPTWQGQGLASAALRVLIDYLFAQTATRRITASIDPRNAPSLRLFARLGFRQEAHHIQSLWFKGEWVDDIVFAVLKSEWTLSRGAPNNGS